MEVKANLQTDFEQLKNPGDFMFSQGDTWLFFVCPCGCGETPGISISDKTQSPHQWKWDGNRDHPTITPSILSLDGCKYHGFLTDGIFRSC